MKVAPPAMWRGDRVGGFLCACLRDHVFSVSGFLPYVATAQSQF